MLTFLMDVSNLIVKTCEAVKIEQKHRFLTFYRKAFQHQKPRLCNTSSGPAPSDKNIPTEKVK